ncbi:uncharacterized protein FTOL_03091 [Fusarium torulosum]|uniref:Uncharacterized protein n=1 Tax=Fusarium torulosum TaxID=33205 RepID=A0AAE8M2Y7_9HYPO|nr:uncharacterized protein FTOL_03091 [Fusarium torulosum]
MDLNPATDENRMEERSIHQIFSDSINEIGRKDSSLFSLSYGRHDRSRDPETGPGADNTSKMMESLKDTLKKMSEQLRHIKDIRDELNILMSIARFQRKVKTTLTLQESEIASFQAQIANRQANESTKQGEESVKQGKIVLVFTLITVWFLPLSFLTSLFALDVASFMKAPAWALYIIFLVPSIFLGSAVAYVWKTQIKGFLKTLRDKANGSSKGANQGTSTARPIPSKISSRKHKGGDEESGGSPSE